jgi:hypothetical protein
MAVRKRAARSALAIAGLLVSTAAPAVGPGWGYVDFARSWGTPQENESGKGSVSHLRVPWGQAFFFAADAERLDAKYDAPKDEITERFELGSVGVGLHTVERTVHLFALADYVEKWRRQHAPSGDTHEPASGAGLAAGARWMATPYLLLEGQYGIKGYVVDGFTKLDLGLRVLPHVWVLGTFNHGPFSGNEYCAGLRWSWEEYSPSLLPGAQLFGGAARDSAGEPSVGQALVTLRALRPQVRPAAGAPEMATIPEGTRIVLVESTSNEFGVWWRFQAGDQPAWIRETDLTGQP